MTRPVKSFLSFTCASNRTHDELEPPAFSKGVMASLSTDDLWASMNEDVLPKAGSVAGGPGTRAMSVQAMMAQVATSKTKKQVKSMANQKKGGKKKKKENKVSINTILKGYSTTKTEHAPQAPSTTALLKAVDRRNMTAADILPTIQRTINCLDSEELHLRKGALKTLRDIFDTDLRPSDEVCDELYEEMMKPLLKRFADGSEVCRMGSIWLVDFFLSLTLDMGQSLPYLFPVIVERSSLNFGYDEEAKEFVRNPEKFEAKRRGKALKTEQQDGCVYTHSIVEPSEEVRLATMNLMGSVIGKVLDSSAPTMLGPYFTDTVLLIAVGACDPYPEVKLSSYRLIRALATKLPPGMKHFAQGFIKLLLPALGHRHAKIRCAALDTVDALMQCPDEMKRKGAGTEAIVHLIGHRDENVLPIAAFYHGEARVNSFAKLVVDNSVPVREKFANILGMWLHDLPDRYDYFTRLLPYMLSCLSDEAPQVSHVAMQWMEKIGKQWEDEHTDEVIERRQYGVDGDRHAQRDIEYPAPFKGRPRLGTRLFVRSNCRRFLQPLMRELGDWKDQTRVHAARLLRVCLVYMEEHMTGHLHELVGCFCRSALYEHADAAKLWMPECAKIVSSFVDPKPFLELLLPVVLGEAAGGRAVSVPLRSSRSQALAVLSPLLEAVSVKRLLPHAKAIAEALCDSHLASSHEVGEKRRHFKCIRSFARKLHGDVDKASEAHFQATGRFLSIERPVLELHAACVRMLTIAKHDAATHVAGADDALETALSAVDALDNLLAASGLEGRQLEALDDVEAMPEGVNVCREGDEADEEGELFDVE